MDNNRKKPVKRARPTVPLPGRMNEERIRALTLPAMPEIGVEEVLPIELLAWGLGFVPRDSNDN